MASSTTMPSSTGVEYSAKSPCPSAPRQSLNLASLIRSPGTSKETCRPLLVLLHQRLERRRDPGHGNLPRSTAVLSLRRHQIVPAPLLVLVLTVVPEVTAPALAPSQRRVDHHLGDGEQI